MSEDIYNSKLYRARFASALKDHKEYIWCKLCTFEYDPFDCLDMTKYPRISGRNLKCPKCHLRIGSMELTKQFPFMVTARSDFY